MDLAALRVFRAVAEEGSVTHAAERLHTVQSNVTTRIRQLEALLDIALFDRINRRLVITPAGRLLLDYAERLLTLAEEAREAIRTFDAPKGLLRLGSMETTAAARLPVLLAAFRRRYPEVDLRLQAAPTQQLLQDVLRHRIDLALVAAPVHHPELAVTVAVIEELVLVSAADYPVVADLRQLDTVSICTFREGCSYRQRLVDWLRSAGITISRINEFGAFEAIIGCVAAGMGFSLLPRSVLDVHLAAGTIRVHPTPPGVAHAETLLVWRCDRSHYPAREAFTALLREKLTTPDAVAA
ncbi:MAG TPA: LysR family transcriptional regulator [Gammaproteobacteria bacterium]|nr:LysR family transcriptional regulator [Gammaproteobacteria bacterium]HRF45151.1 LysR substrate-binding domain-containing protein [Candidatus Competibacteraceae bacterium]